MQLVHRYAGHAAARPAPGRGRRFGAALAAVVLGTAMAPAAHAGAAPVGVAPVAAGSCRPVLAAVTMPDRMYAGEKAAGKIRLSCAPRSKVTVRLSSDRSGLTVPGTVIVKAGHTRATVPVRAEPVAGDRYTARVTARYKKSSSGDDVTVDPGLKKLEIPPSSALNDMGFEILLTGAAPPEGTTVRLASDNPVVTLPPTVVLTRGALGQTFSPLHVGDVSKNTKVTISATLGTRTLRASKVLVPPFDGTQPVHIGLDADGDLYGLEYDRTAYVSLSNPAPADGVQVRLKVRGDDPAIELENTTDTIGEGGSSAYFRFRTSDVTKTAHVVLEATAVGGRAGAKATVPVTVHPRITAVTLPESVKGGTGFTGTVTLAGPSDVPTKVFLQPSWGIVDVQSTLTIPAGKTSATFKATTSTVDEPSQVFVTAYLGNTTFQSDNVTLTP